MKKIMFAYIVLLVFYIIFPTAVFGQYEGLLKPPKELYSGQTDTRATAVGDVNGDGFNDVVAASVFNFDPEWDFKVIVWIQNTSVTPHSFYPPVRYDVVNPRSDYASLFIKDMNGDGLNDVVVDTNKGFGIYYQDGLGNLMNMKSFTTNYHKIFADSIAVGDFNNDGKNDVAIFAYDTGYQMEVFLQNDSKEFTSVLYTPPFVGSIAVGRLNNDTLDDIVIGSGSSIAVYLQNTGGTLDDPVQYDYIYDYSRMAVGDVNGDDRDDVVINFLKACDADLGFFYQNGLGTLTTPPYYWGNKNTNYDWVIKIADVNRDGINDILLLNFTFLVLYQTPGGGMETDYVEYRTLGTDYSITDGIFDFGDINDDGWGDVVFGQNDNHDVTIHHGWNNTSTLVLTSPNGGQTVNIASIYPIVFGKLDPTRQISNVDISYSIDGGHSFSTIEAGLNTPGTEDSWVYWWTAPLTASDNCLVRVSGGGYSDQSYYTFSLVDDGVPRIRISSPNGGENLVAGADHNITWYTTSDVGNVKIEYSTDGGTNWTEIVASTENDGAYTWTVPNITTTQGRVRISEAADNDPTDSSDANFSILAAGTEVINVTSPNGGESLTAGTTHTITWTSVGTINQVVIEYSINNGTSWTTIATTTNTGSYNWTVPNVPSSQCLVRIRDSVDSIPSDQSNSVFSIVASSSDTLTLGTPNGGEVFCIGKVADITWSTYGTVGNIRIQYSTNNGTSWKSVVNSTPNDGSYTWTIPNTPSFQCLVKISEAADGNPVDVSDAVFTIIECGATLSIISPKGGETWKVGSTHDITWASGPNAGANVKIQYSTDSQATWKTVVSSTTNDGSYSWKIPNTPSTQCNVKVGDAADGIPSNTSYGSFAIITGSEVPVIDLNHSHFYYGSVRNSTAKTGVQTLVVDNSGSGILKWQASISDADYNKWLRINNITGVQSGKVEVSVETAGMAAGTYTGEVSVADPNASNSPQILNVTLIVYETGIDADPFGYIETPADGAAVMSSIPVTGWALDDTGIEKVIIRRNPVPGENGEEVYIGDALLVEGLRPDVEQAYPTYPLSYKAGWGYMLLTNFLPNGGNGTCTLHVYARAYGGKEVKLGSRTITCDNAHAVKPFGAIDTPAQGGEAHGNKYRNHGWALTPMPNQIPTNGTTIDVYVDGVVLGHPTYGLYRDDVATLFPGYANSRTAGGYFDLDTTAYENGVHVISWVATDNAGNSDGIGSRYFTIQNTGYNRQTSGKTSRTALPVPGTHRPRPGFAEMLNIPVDKTTPIEATLGYREGEPPLKMTADKDGMIFITLPQDQRLKLNLGRPEAVEHSAYLVFGDRLRPLPVGATLDTREGIFYWQPGPASFGKYPLVFISKDRTGKTVKRQVIIQIVPK